MVLTAPGPPLELRSLRSHSLGPGVRGLEPACAPACLGKEGAPALTIA